MQEEEEIEERIGIMMRCVTACTAFSFFFFLHVTDLF